MFGRRTIASALFLGILMLVLISSLPADSNDRLVVGWVERIAICPGDVILSAKIDTGAVTCSLNSQDSMPFVRNGRNWVRLKISDYQGKEKTVDAPIVGNRRIKRHFGRFQERPVIRLGVCMGTIFKEVDVNLVDRSGLEYPMLIGRNFMEGDFLVNPSSKFTIAPTCSPQAADEQSEQ